MLNIYRRVVLLVVMSAVVIASITAQDYALKPQYELSACYGEIVDYSDTIFWKGSVNAGGTVDLARSEVVEKVWNYDTESDDIIKLSGYVSANPALAFHYGEINMGYQNIYMWVDSSEDTFILVLARSAEGYESWTYYDDSDDCIKRYETIEYDGQNPLALIPCWDDGDTYYIWVGKKTPGKISKVTLVIDDCRPESFGIRYSW